MIRYRKKTKIPDRNEADKAKIKTRVSRMIRNLANVEIILDDEYYFTLSNNSLSGNSGFYSSNVSLTSSSKKFNQKKKFEEKILVYLVISSKGVSKPYMVPSGLAINQDVYIKECLSKRVIPFINEYHSDGEYIFWPD